LSEKSDALAIHERLLALHGGAGLRDAVLLKPALAQPRHIPRELSATIPL
jgi:hypothetical protein